MIEGHLDDDGIAWLTFELIPQHRISADNLADWWCFFLLNVLFFFAQETGCCEDLSCFCLILDLGVAVGGPGSYC